VEEGHGWEIVAAGGSEPIRIEGGVAGGIPGGVADGIVNGVEGQVVVKPGASVIVFERDGDKYVIDDPALVARAKKLAQNGDIDQQARQAEKLAVIVAARLAQEQQRLELPAEEIEKRVEEVRSHLAKLNAELSEAKQNAWTVDDLSHLQSQLAELQERLGTRQDELLDKQAEMQAQVAGLSQQLQDKAAHMEAAQKQKALAEEQMQKLLDEALKSGKAKRQ
jgi:chromosome segregation ATPase